MLKQFSVLTFLSLFSFVAQGQSKAAVLQIAKPNVLAYSKPSFDARVIVNLKQGQKFYALKKKFTGTDGFGLFYKVRLKKGVYAYILDTAVKGFSPAKLGSKKKSKKRKKGGGISGRAKRSREKVKRQKQASYKNYSVPYAKSYGLVLSSLKYGVETAGETRDSNEIFFGAKISGAGWISSLPLDISFSYSPSSPVLFDSFTQSHSGFIILSEAGIPFEIKRASNWSIFANLGGVLSHYSFDFTIGGQSETSKKTEFGVYGGLGGGLRFGRYILKLEGRYIKVGADHRGAQLILQRIF